MTRWPYVGRPAMGAAEEYQKNLDQVWLEAPASAFCLSLADPSASQIHQIVGLQRHLVSSSDQRRQAYVELDHHISADRLAYGGPVAYQAKFKTAFTRLFARLSPRPELSTQINEARSNFDRLSALAFELHHNACTHADVKGGSPTRLIELNYDDRAKRLELSIDDAGPGIIKHFLSSAFGSSQLGGLPHDQVLVELMTSHHSSIPDRTLGGGLPRVMALAQVLDADVSVETNNYLAVKRFRSEQIDIQMCDDSIVGSHWRVSIPVR